MIEADLISLKLQIEYLLDSRAKLVAENRVLRQRLTKMIQQQALWINKKQTILKKLKTLLTKIKEEKL